METVGTEGAVRRNPQGETHWSPLILSPLILSFPHRQRLAPD